MARTARRATELANGTELAERRRLETEEVPGQVPTVQVVDRAAEELRISATAHRKRTAELRKEIAAHERRRRAAEREELLNAVRPDHERFGQVLLLQLVPNRGNRQWRNQGGA